MDLRLSFRGTVGVRVGPENSEFCSQEVVLPLQVDCAFVDAYIVERMPLKFDCGCMGFVLYIRMNTLQKMEFL